MQVLEAEQGLGVDGSRIQSLFTRFSDIAALCEVFQGLPEFAGETICFCELVSMKQRVKPNEPHKSSLLACYRLEFATGKSEHIYLKALTNPSTASETTPGYVGDLTAVIWRFPHDPRLTQLAELVDTEKVKAILPLEKLKLNDARDLTKCEVTVVRYKPEDRCTLHYRIFQAEAAISFFGKTFKDKRGEMLYDTLERLWQWSSRPDIIFQLTQPLGYDKNLKILWQSALGGKPLVQDLECVRDPKFLEQVAKGLAQLHSSDLTSAKIRSAEDCLDEARDISTTLEQYLPQLKGELDALLEKLLDGAAPLPSQSIHGAFRFKQLLVTDEHISVVDFDSFMLGDPNEDVADFIVELEAHLPETVAAQAVRHFLGTYRENVSWHVSDKALNWQRSLKWLEHSSWLRYSLDKNKNAVETIQHYIAKAAHLLTLVFCFIQSFFSTKQELLYGLF